MKQSKKTICKECHLSKVQFARILFLVILHLLNIKGEELELNNFNAKIKTLYNFINEEKIPYKVKGKTLTIDLKNQIKDSINTVLVLNTK